MEFEQTWSTNAWNRSGSRRNFDQPSWVILRDSRDLKGLLFFRLGSIVEGGHRSEFLRVSHRTWVILSVFYFIPDVGILITPFDIIAMAEFIFGTYEPLGTSHYLCREEWGIFLHYFISNQRVYNMLSVGPVRRVKKAKIHCKCKTKSQLGIFNNLVFNAFPFPAGQYSSDERWILIRQ